MEKINFIGLNKSPYRNVYSFHKEQQFFEFVRSFLIDLGFTSNQLKEFGRPYSEREQEYQYDKEEKIETYNNELDNFDNEEYSIDIVSFPDKEVLIINSREDKQKEISEKIEKYINWGE